MWEFIGAAFALVCAAIGIWILPGLLRLLFGGRRLITFKEYDPMHASDLAEAAKHCPFPHCDSLVLHAPGECQVCDLYPTAQAKRIKDRINFTGQRVKGRTKCPSERRRPLSDINAWGGNRPSPHG
jgi:hypothetical protein